MSRKWQIIREFGEQDRENEPASLIAEILHDRGIISPEERQTFLHPKNPDSLTAEEVNIDTTALATALTRIEKAIRDKESVVVYADYDADGITAGATLWETLWKLGARVMPYIPHRVEEGYGLSIKGIDAVANEYDPALIITVDHGITAKEQVEYAKQLGIEVIVTDHHVKPDALPMCTIVHTTKLSGSGVSWFVAKELLNRYHKSDPELIVFPAIGTIADLLPLVGANRAIVKAGLAVMRKTKRIGLDALITEAEIEKSSLSTYSVSHMIAPRLNAMGRLEHALDALRLLCTKDAEKAEILAQKLGLTNKERQKLTEDTVLHAKDMFLKSLTTDPTESRLIFLAHETYNPGVIGLVAGRLTEAYYRPSIVLAIGDGFAKASARSIKGFNVVEAIRQCADLLVDVGGHPMAAGFTVETKNIEALRDRLTALATDQLSPETLLRTLTIDAVIPLGWVTGALWQEIQVLAPFGFGNYEPVFASKNVTITDIRTIGATKKHIKLSLTEKKTRNVFEAVGFNMADEFGGVRKGTVADIAYSIDMNEWNGKRTLQLKVKDIIITP
jgi:single-stranded-DNA-specific exonuclease